MRLENVYSQPLLQVISVVTGSLVLTLVILACTMISVVGRLLLLVWSRD
jgi:hypothetical protein